ncbi:MAG: hypothetical protein CMQ53_03575 [Gammaproteobacteria bacterium]|nr:hypothetical protein [Gammaproteobacteria bacterium]
MKLFYYFYKKTIFSFTICIISSSVVFYVFSLLGNLGEKLSFFSILIVSFLNTLQILTYIPSFIILLSLIILIIFLRSKNELMIFKEYLSLKRLIIFFLPLALIFAFIEINKNIFQEKIENVKSNFLKSNSLYDTKVIISERDNFKSYTILKGLDIPNSKVKEFQRYEISNGKVQIAEYSNQIKIKDNIIFTNNFSKYENDKIFNKYNKNIIVNDLYKTNNKNLVTKKINEGSIFYYESKDIIKALYFLIFFICIFIILFNKKVIDQKRSILFTISICLTFLFYSIIIFNVKLNFFNTELQVLALLLIFLSFFKFTKYE